MESGIQVPHEKGANLVEFYSFNFYIVQLLGLFYTTQKTRVPFSCMDLKFIFQLNIKLLKPPNLMEGGI